MSKQHKAQTAQHSGAPTSHPHKAAHAAHQDSSDTRIGVPVPHHHHHKHHHHPPKAAAHAHDHIAESDVPTLQPSTEAVAAHQDSSATRIDVPTPEPPKAPVAEPEPSTSAGRSSIISFSDDLESGPLSRSPQKLGPRKSSLSERRQFQESSTILVGKDVTLKQLQAHNVENDAWLSIKGCVYDVSNYMTAHPGGPNEMMRGVGKEATKIFNAVHPWVRCEPILKDSFVGTLVDTTKPKRIFTLLFGKKNVPPVSVEWFQTKHNIFVQLIMGGDMPQTRVMLYASPVDLIVNVKLGHTLYITHVELDYRVSWPCEVVTDYDSRRIEVCLFKIDNIYWKTLGSPADDNGKTLKLQHAPFDPMTLVCSSELSYNTKLLMLRHRQRILDTTPIGCKVKVLAKIGDTEATLTFAPVRPAMDKDFWLPEWRQDCLFLAVRLRESKLNKFMYGLGKGEVAVVSRPEGSFRLTLTNNKNQLCLLVEDLGLASLTSLIVWALAREKFQKINLVYFNKENRDILWHDQLDSLVRKYKKRWVLL